MNISALLGFHRQDSLLDIAKRQGNICQILVSLERAPVIGAAISIPGILISLIVATVKIGQVAFRAIQARWNNAQHYQIQRTKLLWNAADWGRMLLNQIANLCTLGILNNFAVNALLWMSREPLADEL